MWSALELRWSLAWLLPLSQLTCFAVEKAPQVRQAPQKAHQWPIQAGWKELWWPSSPESKSPWT